MTTAKKKKSGIHRFTATLQSSDNKLWSAHLPVPVSVAQSLIDGGNKRVICTIDGTERFQCAILFYSKGRPVVSVNRNIQKKLGLEIGGTAQVQLEKDTSAYGLPLPAELTEVFRQDPEGKKIFHSLTPGKQRTLLYIIGGVKDPEKRIFRSLMILRHLNEQHGKIDYKKLQELLKNPRTRR